MIPYSLLKRTDINLIDKVVFRHIWGFGRQGCYQANETIAKLFGIGASTVSRGVNKLYYMGTLYLKGQGKSRHVWAISNPEVIAEIMLPYKGTEIPKAMLRHYPEKAHLKPNQIGKDICSNRQDIIINKNKNKNNIKAMPSPLPAQGQSQTLHIYYCGESPIPIEPQRIWINFETCRIEQKARLAI